MEIKYTAHAEYSNGRASDFNGFGCKSFTSEADVDAWAKDQLSKDPGAVITVWKAYTSEVHRVYQA